NQHASGRIDSEGAQLDSASVGVLDQRRLASRLINGPDRDAILAASRHFLAVNCHSRGLAVRLIEEAAVRVHVDGAGVLPRPCFARIDQRILREYRIARQPGCGMTPIDIELALTFE